MKKNLLLFSFLLFSINTLLGQNRDYKILIDAELKIINDLTSTFRDSSLSFMLSPLIFNSFDTTSIKYHELTIKYGFDKNDLNFQMKDTFLLKKNDFFNIVNPDSLHNWRSIVPKVKDEDPVLDKIEKYHQKLGLCSFNKIIYSKDRKYVIVQYWMDSIFLYEYGETILMEKVNNRWIRLETLLKLNTVPNIK